MSHSAHAKKLKLKQKLVNKTKTICLTMIVKNESKNMVRLLNSVKPIIDYVSIVDTGSTDETVLIIESWLSTNKIPGKVHHEPFINFGYNRTHSIVKAREAFPQANYYLLSDADFIWEIDVCGKFNKKLLHEHKYLVRQTNNNLSYFNIRMLSSEVDWECVGVTHEYWSEKSNNRYKGEIRTHTLKTIQIDDREDGGCKSDKFIRDRRLLEEDLKNPELPDFLRTRYSFYLAQTYKCLSEYQKSIEEYKRRIDYGGWFEEIYYSMYQIGFNYKSLFEQYKHVIHIMDKEVKSEPDQKYIELHALNMTKIDVELKKNECFDLAIKWFVDGWTYRPSRAESLYAAVSLLREYNHHRKAYDLAILGRKIPMTDDTLFVELSPYNWGFDYELSIVAYYLKEHEIGAECCEKLLDRDDLEPHIRNKVQENSKYYT